MLVNLGHIQKIEVMLEVEEENLGSKKVLVVLDTAQIDLLFGLVVV